MSGPRKRVKPSDDDYADEIDARKFMREPKLKPLDADDIPEVDGDEFDYEDELLCDMYDMDD